MPDFHRRGFREQWWHTSAVARLIFWRIAANRRWWNRWDSNPRPPDPKSGALPPALLLHVPVFPGCLWLNHFPAFFATEIRLYTTVLSGCALVFERDFHFVPNVFVFRHSFPSPPLHLLKPAGVPRYLPSVWQFTLHHGTVRLCESEKDCVINPLHTQTSFPIVFLLDAGFSQLSPSSRDNCMGASRI